MKFKIHNAQEFIIEVANLFNFIKTGQTDIFLIKDIRVKNILKKFIGRDIIANIDISKKPIVTLKCFFDSLSIDEIINFLTIAKKYEVKQ